MRRRTARRREVTPDVPGAARGPARMPPADTDTVTDSEACTSWWWIGDRLGCRRSGQRIRSASTLLMPHRVRSAGAEEGSRGRAAEWQAPNARGSRPARSAP
jgi:hypothetical protein